MRKLVNFILIFLLANVTLLAHADLSDSFIVPKEESAFAKEYMRRIYVKDLDYARSKFDPQILNQMTDANLLMVANHFPSGKMLSTELIGSTVNEVDGLWQGQFTFEYHFEQGWAIAWVALKRENEQLTVEGFRLKPTKVSQKEINRFSLSGKSALQYLVLAATVVVPLFILFTLVVCIKTPIPKRKWLWVLFIIFGIGAVYVNWTDGQFGYGIVQFQLFGAAAVASGEYAPWIFTAGLPVGAIAFWFKRKTFLQHSRALKQDATTLNAEPVTEQDQL